MCSVIVACNTSVIRVLCHVGNRHNEPRRYSRASYALARQRSHQQSVSQASQDEISPPRSGIHLSDKDIKSKLKMQTNSHCELSHSRNNHRLEYKTNSFESTLPIEGPSCYSHVPKPRDLTSSHCQHYHRQLSEDRDSSSIRLTSDNKASSHDGIGLLNWKKTSTIRNNHSTRSSGYGRRSSLTSTASGSFNHVTSEELAFAKLMTVLSILFVLCWMPQYVSHLNVKSTMRVSLYIYIYTVLYHKS